jgi:serine/threonine protein kinase
MLTKYGFDPALCSCADGRLQRLCREALVWRQLRHANILPFIGLNRSLFPGNSLPALISPWMTHGSLKDYVESPGYEARRESYRLVCLIYLEIDPSRLTTTVLVSDIQYC